MTTILTNGIVIPGHPIPESANPVVKHNPWDRLPGEQDAAWEAYRRYRNMPSSKRNLTALKTILIKERDAAEESGDFDNVPTVRYLTLSRWSKEYNWAERTAAWDAETDKAWQDETLLVIREAARRQWENSKELQRVGMLALQLINPQTLADKFPQEVRHFIIDGGEQEQAILGVDEKDGQEQTNSPIFLIKMVGLLEERLTEKENLAIEGEFKQIENTEDVYSG